MLILYNTFQQFSDKIIPEVNKFRSSIILKRKLMFIHPSIYTELHTRENIPQNFFRNPLNVNKI